MQLKRRPNPPEESTLILFGNPRTEDVAQSINRAAITKRRVEVKSAPAHETGQGNCGKLCHCPKGHCAMEYKHE